MRWEKPGEDARRQPGRHSPARPRARARARKVEGAPNQLPMCDPSFARVRPFTPVAVAVRGRGREGEGEGGLLGKKRNGHLNVNKTEHASTSAREYDGGPGRLHGGPGKNSDCGGCASRVEKVAADEELELRGARVPEDRIGRIPRATKAAIRINSNYRYLQRASPTKGALPPTDSVI